MSLVCTIKVGSNSEKGGRARFPGWLGEMEEVFLFLLSCRYAVRLSKLVLLSREAFVLHGSYVGVANDDGGGDDDRQYVDKLKCAPSSRLSSHHYLSEKV